MLHIVMIIHSFIKLYKSVYNANTEDIHIKYAWKLKCLNINFTFFEIYVRDNTNVTDKEIKNTLHSKKLKHD
jgi:hypothetical protein